MKCLQQRLLLLLALTVSAVDPAAAVPRHVYLTWSSNPSTAITVNAQTLGAEATPVEVRYDTVSHGGDPSAYRRRVTATGIHVAAAGRTLHTAQLTGLQPGRGYWFVVGDEHRGFGRERALRTVPGAAAPLRFVVGGDMGTWERARRLQAAAAAQDPLFAIVGGDLAYARDGRWSGLPTWDLWFDNWDSLMVTPGGFTVPIVAVIGNHEVAGGYRGSAGDAAPYLAFFPQGAATSYYRRDLGDRVVLLVLDSGHLAPHGGAQAEWLAAQLADAADRPVKLAAYHVPLFPSFRLPSSRWSADGRRHWQPLFDRYRLTAAFEHHDHAFKRSHPIRADGVDAGGTLYVGDGAWGKRRVVTGPRQVHLARRWYLDSLASKLHVWCVDVGADSVVLRAVDETGRAFDRVARPVGP